jgi:nitrogen fixation NifU-like protein
MSELRELYQQVILDHNKSPRNFRKIEDATADTEGFNPLCGDHIHLYLSMDGDRIDDVAFEGSGCAISKASASLMTSLLKGKTTEEADTLFDQFHGLLTTDVDPDLESLGKLAVFAGVREFPTRVKCATLAWHTLKAALAGQDNPVTTE